MPSCAFIRATPLSTPSLPRSPTLNLEDRFLDFIHGDDVTRVTTEIQAAITERASKQIETRIRRADNATFDAELSLGYIYEFGNLICIIRDITERKQAEQALNVKINEEREFQQYLKALHEITIEDDSGSERPGRIL